MQEGVAWERAQGRLLISLSDDKLYLGTLNERLDSCLVIHLKQD